MLLLQVSLGIIFVSPQGGQGGCGPESALLGRFSVSSGMYIVEGCLHLLQKGDSRYTNEVHYVNFGYQKDATLFAGPCRYLRSRIEGRADSQWCSVIAIKARRLCYLLSHASCSHDYRGRARQRGLLSETGLHSALFLKRAEANYIQLA